MCARSLASPMNTCPRTRWVLAANEDVAAGHKTVDWCFTTMPSEEWKNGVGAALLEYAQGTGDGAVLRPLSWTAGPPSMQLPTAEPHSTEFYP